MLSLTRTAFSVLVFSYFAESFEIRQLFIISLLLSSRPSLISLICHSTNAFRSGIPIYLQLSSLLYFNDAIYAESNILVRNEDIDTLPLGERLVSNMDLSLIMTEYAEGERGMDCTSAIYGTPSSRLGRNVLGVMLIFITSCIHYITNVLFVNIIENYFVEIVI